MAEKTTTRPTEGDGQPGKGSVSVNQNNTTPGAKNQAKPSHDHIYFDEVIV